jgi:carbonic anhydrase
MRLSTVLGLTLFLAAPALFAADGCVSYNYCQNWTGTCETGNFQSPIANNARDRTPNPHLGALGHYNETDPVPVTIKNTGTTVKIEPSDGGRKVSLEYDGKRLTLDEFHFHTPAEHKLDIWLVPCHNFAVAELHLVHKDPNGKTVVVAVPIYLGASNAGLAALKAAGPLPTNCNPIPYRIGPAALAALLPQVTGRYITYEGSLTTPSCGEGVTFLLLNDGISATQAELDYVKVVYNARPVQHNSKPVTFRVAKTGE